MIRKTFLLSLLVAGLTLGQGKVTSEKEASLKADVANQIDGMKKQAQVMVDTVFSFGELGFQEVETSKYLSTILFDRKAWSFCRSYTEGRPLFGPSSKPVLDRCASEEGIKTPPLFKLISIIDLGQKP